MMWPLLVSTIVASWVGSLHCAGMCGPMVALASGGRARVSHAALYNIGRGTSYVLLGALAGWVGHYIDRTGAVWMGVQRIAAIAAAAIMLLWGLWMIFGQHALRHDAVSRMIQTLLRPLMRAAYQSPSVVRPLWVGLLTPLLPCGWLYLYVATAAGTGSPVLGAWVMAAFWLGNVPVLMALGTVFARMRQWFGTHAQTWAGVVLIMGALLTFIMRVPHHRASSDPIPGTCHGHHQTEPK